MTKKVSDFLIERLKEWGVTRIFGYPGDGINGILGALNRADNPIEFIQVRHEEMAAFMACAHAKFTGEVGVCLASSGPGAIHLLNGLYDAKMDHVSVVALLGQTVRSAIGSNFQQEVDLKTLFKDVAGDFIEVAMVPAQVRHLVDRAFRIAKGERTVTALILPHDLQDVDAIETPKHEHGYVRSGTGYSAPRVIPTPKDLMRAADVLNAGQKVAILVGAGALEATAEVIAVAELLGGGVAKALLGLAVVPDDLPFVTGSIGLLGTKPSYDMMLNCDTLLMIGSSFPYSEFLPQEGQARGVQIDISSRMLSLRYPMEVNLVGDSAETLRALLPMLQPKTDRSWQDGIRKNICDWWGILEARAMVDATPLNPQRVFWELSKRLPDNAMLCTDTGTSTVWFANDIKIRRGMMATASGSLASMGNGVPYAIGAKFAYPDRPCFAFVGDGAMEMNGNSELVTIAKYWKQWADPRLIILVLNNRDLNFVTWEMRAMEGDPKFEASQNLPDFPYTQYAQSLGLKGIRMDNPNDVGAAWDEALASDRPVVIEAVTDPNIPPLPPHISFEQAKDMGFALLKGDPNSLDVMRLSIKEMVDSVLHP